MSKTVDFEQALFSLEQIVSQLEHGELPLNDALKQFETGISLTRVCQNHLSAAEKKLAELNPKSTQQSENPKIRKS